MLGLIAASLSSCKSRKVQKDYSKEIDKSSQNSVVSKIETTQDFAKVSLLNNIKESIKTNSNFDKVESKSDTSTIVTEKSKVTEFDSLGRKTKETSIVKSTVKNHKASNKKGNANNETQTDKIDYSKMDWIQNHSMIDASDSLGNKINDIKKIEKHKATESKMDWIKMGVGAGVLFLICLIGYFAFRRFNK